MRRIPLYNKCEEKKGLPAIKSPVAHYHTTVTEIDKLNTARDNALNGRNLFLRTQPALGKQARDQVLPG